MRDGQIWMCGHLVHHYQTSHLFQHSDICHMLSLKVYNSLSDMTLLQELRDRDYFLTGNFHKMNTVFFLTTNPSKTICSLQIAWPMLSFQFFYSCQTHLDWQVSGVCNSIESLVDFSALFPLPLLRSSLLLDIFSVTIQKILQQSSYDPETETIQVPFTSQDVFLFAH